MNVRQLESGLSQSAEIIGSSTIAEKEPEVPALCSLLFRLLKQTAKANGLEPEEYIRNLFEQAPYCESKEDWKNLLPWNIELKPFDDSGEWV